jgi:hypothetical protein
MKMGQRLRCSSVTYRFRYAPLSRALPVAHFDRNESSVIYGTGHHFLVADVRNRARTTIRCQIRWPPFTGCASAGAITAFLRVRPNPATLVTLSIPWSDIILSTTNQ